MNIEKSNIIYQVVYQEKLQGCSPFALNAESGWGELSPPAYTPNFVSEAGESSEKRNARGNRRSAPGEDWAQFYGGFLTRPVSHSRKEQT